MFSADVHPAIAALMAELPKPGEVFPVIKRDRWIAAMEAMLDMLYPDRVAHAVTCAMFPDPHDERDPAGPCTCGVVDRAAAEIPAPPVSMGGQNFVKPGHECEGCPPIGYPTDKTRCDECPRRADETSATTNKPFQRPCSRCGDPVYSEQPITAVVYCSIECAD